MIAVARLAIVFGVAGLLPFLGAVATVYLMPQYSVAAVSWFYVYSAGILAFMAGVYWPISMQLDDCCYPQSPLVTMVFSQIFFVTAGVGLLLSTPGQILLYTIAYLALYLVDARWMRLYWPDWYLRLRLFLTFVVLLCQVAIGVWYVRFHGA